MRHMAGHTRALCWMKAERSCALISELKLAQGRRRESTADWVIRNGGRDMGEARSL